MLKPLSRRLASLLPFLLPALLGVFCVLFLTRFGPGVSGDAVHYMDGARNLLNGHGYARSAADGSYKPITGFPPVFSILMSVGMLLTADALQAGRWLNALLFGCNIFLLGFLSYRLTRSWLVGLFASLFALTFRDALLVHSWAMSEAAYITLTLLGFLFFLLYVEGERCSVPPPTSHFPLPTSSWLIAAALASGFSVLARYVGLAQVGALGLGILLLSPGHWGQQRWGQQRWGQRFKDAFWFGLISILPFFLWLARNALVAGNLTARKTAYHPISRAMFVAFFDEMSSWFVPNALHFSWRPRLVVFALFLLVGLALFAWRFWRNRAALQVNLVLQSVMAIFLAAYLAIVFVNMLTLDASTSQEGLRRYLIPVYFVLVLWLLTVFYQGGKHPTPAYPTPTLPIAKGSDGEGADPTPALPIAKGSDGEGRVRWARLAGGLVALALWFVYLVGALNFLLWPGYAFGYTDIRNTAPDLIAAFHALDPQRPLISNDYELIYFLAGRPPYGLPQTYDNFTRQQNEDLSGYYQSKEQIEQLLRNGAVLAAYMADANPELEALLPALVRWQTFGNIVFYVHPDFLK